MNIEDYLPSERWMSNAKDLIKDPKVIASAGALGLAGFLMPPIIFLPWWPYVIWAYLIKHFLNLQTERKINAILDAFPGKYSASRLRELHAHNRVELNRLFRLASDEFFRKYVQEQAEHAKAQKIIVQLQERLEAMRQRLEFMQKKASKHKAEIEALKEDLRIYDEILAGWRRKAA